MKTKFAIVLLLVCLLPTCVVAQKFNRAVSFASNFEAPIPRPEQDKLAQAKLAQLKAKMGKRPNIVWIIIDDMGYGDPGCYGGGAAIGAATENIDRLAREGLRLTS
ncbi:MAG: sulfatase-like hydrolase/transferase, partial [Planctomycetaceae bacterium]|nr:sulfatase-like hydrolase/transferase [Planctomycetaceae bacterium]